LREVEWILIQMPLPRLQVMGSTADPFLYRIAWGLDVKRGTVAAYQRGDKSVFDPAIRLAPQAGEHLVALSGLLRPLVQQQWTRKVAQLNRLEESQLERFLFGVERISTEALRPSLQDLQEQRCFYCAGILDRSPATRPQVDHFIPWARYPTNAVENLVVAHERCNLHKRDFLAEPTHVRRWRERTARQSEALAQLASKTRWEHHPPETENVARAIYLRLPSGSRLWTSGAAFVPLDREALLEVFR
jgi:5-methylcytosine-specific restriction endonuclease McrA